jgi:hypothetical protein
MPAKALQTAFSKSGGPQDKLSCTTRPHPRAPCARPKLTQLEPGGPLISRHVSLWMHEAVLAAQRLAGRRWLVSKRH